MCTWVRCMVADALKRNVRGKCRQSATSSGRYERENKGQRVQMSKDKQLQVTADTNNWRGTNNIEWQLVRTSRNKCRQVWIRKRTRSGNEFEKTHKQACHRNSTDVWCMCTGRTMLREKTNYHTVSIALQILGRADARPVVIELHLIYEELRVGSI